MKTSLLSLAFPGDGAALWQYMCAANGRMAAIAPPIFRVNGTRVTAHVARFDTLPARNLPQGAVEYRSVGDIVGVPGLRLEIVFQVVDESPIVRFQYRLYGTPAQTLTNKAGGNDLAYMSLSLADFERAIEVRFSEFNPLFHSFMLVEQELSTAHFTAEEKAMGPMLVGTSDDAALLLAYEHGSQYPDAFLRFQLNPDKSTTLHAVKGNYYDGQTLGPDAPFVSAWFQFGMVAGDEDTLAWAYREWVLRFQSPNLASRTPYIFYNTWNYEERVYNWYKKPDPLREPATGQPSYLADMNETRMLAEIEVAHKMGIDVFVIDTSWYEKTGDWQVSAKRFPRGLAPIVDKLNSYGMKLGLWFNPTVAAVSSSMRKMHEDCLMQWNGVPQKPHEVWETEASQGLSLVSRYAEAFADELIRLHREWGVTYFKWDAIGQYGSDTAGNFHGTDANTVQERRDGYAFLLGRYMVKVVDKLCAACPEAIVDFDITEGGRTVGLEFLGAGKYFLINNGPYFHDYNIPVGTDGNVNMFFHPGPARAWICRAPLSFDKWIPSVLFLTHYLPDDDHSEGWQGQKQVTGENQWIAIASLVLGQNGIWGDLCALSEAGIARFGTALGLYKQVRGDITRAYPVRVGMVGGSPEVHEKIWNKSGRGVVSVFAGTRGTYTYITQNTVTGDVWHNHGVEVKRLPDGKARIVATFGNGEYAKVIFFGIAVTEEK